MANGSLLLATGAPSVSTTPLLGLLGHPHHLLSDPIIRGGGSGSGSGNHSMMGYGNNTTRAYRTATLRNGGGGGGVGGGGMEGAGEEGEDLGSCHDWQDAQHTLFQLANLCMAVSFLTPASFRFHLHFLRCLLLLAFLLFVLWAGLFICMPDVLGWNLVFLLINGAHIAWLLYTHLPSRLPVSYASLYTKVFKPVRVTQTEFLELCQLASLQTVNKGGLYAMEGLTPCAQHLSVLLKGRLKVTYQRLFLHYVDVTQFVDAAEYDSLALQHDNNDKYQVSIAATEESVLMTWDYRTLQDYLSTNPFMQNMLHYLTGKDVCSHLYAIQEQLMHDPDNSTCTLNSRRSSVVNVRSCLAVHESSSSLSHIGTNFPGHKQVYDVSSSSSSPTRLQQHPSPSTVETRV